MSGNLIQANAIQIPLKNESVQLCCFSPPYWKLRKYRVPDIEFPDRWTGQLGQEPSIDLFLDHTMMVMAEVWRILRDDGVCFVNIGDSFWNPRGSHFCKGYGKNLPHVFCRGDKTDNPGIKPKSLCLIPQKFAIRCQEAGWIVRSEIIWNKLNPMPESVKDRPARDHEQIWLLVKRGKYFWGQEAVAQPQAGYERARRLREKKQGHKAVYALQADGKTGQAPQSISGVCKNVEARQKLAEKGTRNIRTVWAIASEPSPAPHFATWPSRLVETMIRAGSSSGACEVCRAPWERIVGKIFIPQEDVSLERGIWCCPGQKPLDETDNRSGFPRGSNRAKTMSWQSTCKCNNKGIGKCVVADIFCGVGTSVLVAEKLGRTGIGLDLSSEYLWDIAKEKIEAPMQKEIF